MYRELHDALINLPELSKEQMLAELEGLRCNQAGVCIIEISSCTCLEDKPQVCESASSLPELRLLAQDNPSCKCRNQAVRLFLD